MPEPLKRIKQELKKRGYRVYGIYVFTGGIIFTEDEEEMPVLPRVVIFIKTNISDEIKKTELEFMLTRILESYGENWENYIVEILDTTEESEEKLEVIRFK
ncbi:MAG: hypothetical protein ACO2O4_03920 [Minisyncoccia bacterium]|jgi:hypothetical protein